MRADKYLWAVRLFKTRSIAADACKNGRIQIQGVNVKPARTLKEGDVFIIKKNSIRYTFKISAFPKSRVGAKLVQDYLINQTPPEELLKLEMEQQSGFLARSKGTGRPTKKERRVVEDFLTAIYWDEDDDDTEVDISGIDQHLDLEEEE